MSEFCLICIVIAPHSETELEARNIIRDVQSRITTQQGRWGMPGLWLGVLEGTAGVHSNLIFPVPSKKAGLKLINSMSKWKFDPDVVKVMDRKGTRDGFVYDAKGLRGYLLKESTTQAWWAANKSFRREKGSHKLGEGGGDRVHMSRALKDDLVGSARIAPRKRTYVKRSLRKPVKAKAPFLARLLWQAPITVGSVLGVADEDCRHRLRVPALATTRQPYRKEYACAGA